MSIDGGSWEFFEYSELYFSCGQSGERVEIAAKTFQGFTRKPDDKVEVEMGVGLVFQKVQVFL